MAGYVQLGDVSTWHDEHGSGEPLVLLHPEHFPVVAGKLARMHAEEPTLAASALSDVRNRTLVMVGDDDEVTLEHAIELYGGSVTASLLSCPALRTACWSRRRTCATRS